MSLDTSRRFGTLSAISDKAQVTSGATHKFSHTIEAWSATPAFIQTFETQRVVVRTHIV